MIDPLDELLRAEPYVDDKGFTQKVLATLPPRKSPVQARRRVLLGAGLAAALVAIVGPGRALWGMVDATQLSWTVVAAAALSLAVGAGTALSVALREAES